MTVQIRSLTIKSRVTQSPMAGCTDLAFRLIAREKGLELAFTEMISADALARKNKATLRILARDPADKPLGTQLFGSRPETMAKAAAMMEAMGFDLLDLNLGCPVPKVTRGGSGSALLQKPALAEKIFESVLKTVQRIPVTVKLRKGFLDPSGAEALRIAKIAEETGIAAITVHGRMRAQGYSGKADWDIIRRVKETVKIPVFGNGDIFSGADAALMMEKTGCDAVMIGRGALGNPWIYQAAQNALQGKAPPPLPALEEMKRTCLKHIELLIQLEGKRIGFLKARKIATWYFKTLPKTAELRNRIFRSQSLDDMEKTIDDFCRRAQKSGLKKSPSVLV